MAPRMTNSASPTTYAGLHRHAQYGWGANSHLRVGGIVRSMTYTSTLRNHASDVTGWGVQASASFNLSKMGNLRASYFGKYRTIFERYRQSECGHRSNPEKEGKMQALPVLGAWFAGTV